ncbi:MAG: long-chain acyl-CoA synthetase [Rubrivivax sp.]|nr:AMP-binding protein [Rubrivivax sp.]
MSRAPQAAQAAQALHSSARPQGAAGARHRISGSHGRDARSARRRTLPQLLFALAAERAQAPFLRAKRQGIWVERSWGEVAAQVRTLAHALRGRGVGHGDVLVMISENLPEIYLLEYAAQALGAAVTCLYPDASSAELDYIVQHSGARLLVAQDQEQVDKALALEGAAAAQLQTLVYLEDRGLWDYTDPRLLSLPALIASGARPDAQDEQALQRCIDEGQDTQVAVLCYTSGTTGRPKGVVLTHRYLTDNAYRLLASFEVPRDIAYLSYISPAWAAEQIIGLALGLMAPSVVHFAEKPATVQADLREIGPQFLLFTPRQWEMMDSAVAGAMLDAGRWRRRLVDWALSPAAREGWRGWLAERLVKRAIRDNLGLKQAVIALSAGSGMSAEVFGRFHALGVPLRNLYGSTEAGLLTAHWGGAFDAATLGRLLQVDPEVGPVLQAEVGDDDQLRVQGGSGFAGYHRDAAATAEVVQDGRYATGDAIRVTEDGEFVFLDRVKDLRLLQGGRRFPPQFIENHLRASPYVRDAIAIGDERRPHVTVLVNIDARIVGRHAEQLGLAWGTFADLSQLSEVHALLRQTLAQINARLDPHARALAFAAFPKELDADDEELTRSRKLRRDVIEQRYAALIDAMYAGAPSCPVEVLVRYRDGSQAHVRQQVRITPV